MYPTFSTFYQNKTENYLRIVTTKFSFVVQWEGLLAPGYTTD